MFMGKVIQNGDGDDMGTIAGYYSRRGDILGRIISMIWKMIMFYEHSRRVRTDGLGTI